MTGDLSEDLVNLLTDLSPCRASWAGLDYDSCSLKELSAFVQARSDSEDETIKQLLIRVLKRADSRAQFRFLDLPQELRDHIYAELLNIPEGGKSCTPQILATARSIHKEAQSILYESNSFDIVFERPRGSRRDNTQQNTPLLRIPQLRDREYHGLHILSNALPMWPKVILNFRHIHMYVELADDLGATERGLRDYHHLLFGFACFIQTSVQLRSVTIHAKLQNKMPSPPELVRYVLKPDLVRFHLRPLSRIYANFKVDLRGFEGYEGVAEALHQDAVENKDLYAVNLLKLQAQLAEERSLAKSLLRAKPVYSEGLKALDTAGLLIMTGLSGRTVMWERSFWNHLSLQADILDVDMRRQVVALSAEKRKNSTFGRYMAVRAERIRSATAGEAS